MIDYNPLEQIRYYPLPYRIRRLRRLLGMSQKEFAQHINSSQTLIALWEGGKNAPSEKSLDKIVAAFDLPSDFFLDIDIQRLG